MSPKAGTSSSPASITGFTRIEDVGLRSALFAQKAKKFKTFASSNFAIGSLKGAINLINRYPEEGSKSGKKSKDSDEPEPPHATIAEWCIDNRVLFHPLNPHLDNAEESTIDEDVLRHLRNTILRPPKVSTDFLKKPLIPGEKGPVPKVDATIAHIERIFGRQTLADLVNGVCMDARMMYDSEARHYPEFSWRSRGWDRILEACEKCILLDDHLDLSGQPKISELTSTTCGNLALRLMLRQEEEILYPKIATYEWAQRPDMSMRSVYQHFSEGIELHIQNMEKKLKTPSSDEEQLVWDYVKWICRRMCDAMRNQTTPIPKEERRPDVRLTKSIHVAENKAEAAWDSSKLAWAEARISQYPLRGKMDSTLAWDVTLPWSQLMGDAYDPKVSNAIMDALECMPTNKDGKSMNTKSKTSRPFSIPILVVENKTQPAAQTRPEVSIETQARNQRLFYCVSAIRMLSELQIKNFPVIGLATSGRYATFCAAWWSDNYIPEGSYNIAIGDEMAEFSYDLADPEQVLQFIVIVFRLRKHGLAVIELFQECSLPWIMSSAVKEVPPSWTLVSQVESMGLAPKQKAKADTDDTE